MDKSLLIWGSCVTRDPFDSFPIKGSPLRIESYISKTSVVSQYYSPVPEKLEHKVIGDDFASRMVRYDLDKSVAGIFEKSNADFIVFDFIDERLPHLKGANSYYTASRFFYEKGLKEIFKGREIFVNQTDTFELWKVAFENFATSLKAIGVKEEKLILHKAWWSRFYSQDGKAVRYDEEKLKQIHLNNVFLSNAYSLFKKHFPKSRSIEVDKSLFMGDSLHKWGPDPYHYTSDYYKSFSAKLITLVTGKECVAEESISDTKKIIPNAPASKVRVDAAGAIAPGAMKLPSANITTLKASSSKYNARLVEGSGFYKGLTDKRDPFIKEYALELPYLSHYKEDISKFRDTGIQFDEDGVPKNMFRWGGPYYYSVTIGHHGLASHAKYVVDKDPMQLQHALSVADWLVRNQSAAGAWEVHYDHNWFPPRCEVIKSPWTSAMGQGLCISVLSRLVFLSKKDSEIKKASAYLLAAKKAVQPFSTPVSDGGVRSLFLDKHVFYEEYPTRPSSYVLNGFIYSLLGLYDLASLTKDKSTMGLYKDGIETLKKTLCFYDLGFGTAYDLTHLSCKGYPPNIARQSYHFIHVQLLSVLNLIEKGCFSEFLERWNYYYHGWGVKTN